MSENGEKPDAEQVTVEQVKLEKKIVFESRLTEVVKQADGTAIFSHVVNDGAQPVEYAFVANPEDVTEALKALSGGLVIP